MPTIYVPYTYWLFHKKTKKFYYGSRTAKDCNPTDLFKSYFSSSKIVKKIIKEEGVSAFLYRVDKKFQTAKDALDYEYSILRKFKAGNNERFLNEHHSRMLEWTAERKLKASRTHKLRIINDTHSTAFKNGHVPTKGFSGKNHNEKTKKILSELNSGNKNVSCRPEVREIRRQHMIRNNPAKNSTVKHKMSISAKNRAQITCPYCNKTGKVPGMYRYHFNYCKIK